MVQAFETNETDRGLWLCVGGWNGCVRKTNCRATSKWMLLAGMTARARLNFLRRRSFSPSRENRQKYEI